ncbi:MAG: hypothetical protein ACXQTO_05170 [Candidatus Syntropharchaeales archaeon]
MERKAPTCNVSVAVQNLFYLKFSCCKSRSYPKTLPYGGKPLRYSFKGGGRSERVGRCRVIYEIMKDGVYLHGIGEWDNLYVEGIDKEVIIKYRIEVKI